MKKPITMDEHQQLATRLNEMRAELRDIERWLASKNLGRQTYMPTRLLRARHHLDMLASDLTQEMANQYPDSTGVDAAWDLYNPDSTPVRRKMEARYQAARYPDPDPKPSTLLEGGH
jgi:hypothetical protein